MCCLRNIEQRNCQERGECYSCKGLGHKHLTNARRAAKIDQLQ